jgi:hypothetical protein
MRFVQGAFLGLSLALTAGCATPTASQNQSVSLRTVDVAGNPIDGVDCKLRNDKGAWEATSPTFVPVRRSAENLEIICRRDGMLDGLATAISRVPGGMLGRILFGGGIDALIDHGTGSGYNYPNNLVVEMGRNKTLDRREEDLANPANAAK